MGRAAALLALTEPPGRGGVALAASPAVLAKLSTPDGGNSAEISRFPRRKLPPVSDYAARCASLIRETFPARSQHQTCIRAAQMTGASPDSIERILTGITKSPDARLMLVVLSIRAAYDPRPFNLGDGFSVRVTIEGTE